MSWKMSAPQTDQTAWPSKRCWTQLSAKTFLTIYVARNLSHSENLTMCVARGPFPPSLAAVGPSFFGHGCCHSQVLGFCCLSRQLGSWQTLHPPNLSSGGQVGSLPSIVPFISWKSMSWRMSPEGKRRSWWSSQLTFLGLGRKDGLKLLFPHFWVPLGKLSPRENKNNVSIYTYTLCGANIKAFNNIHRKLDLKTFSSNAHHPHMPGPSAVSKGCFWCPDNRQPSLFRAKMKRFSSGHNEIYWVPQKCNDGECGWGPRWQKSQSLSKKE